MGGLNRGLFLGLVAVAMVAKEGGVTLGSGQGLALCVRLARHRSGQGPVRVCWGDTGDVSTELSAFSR